MNPGLKLKIKRIEKGYKQEDLGALIGVSRQAISLYERGKLSPKLENMKKLSSILNIPIEQLFID